MADRPKRISIMGPRDEEIELTEDETAMLYKLADHEGVTPEIFFKSMVNANHLLMRHNLLRRVQPLDGVPSYMSPKKGRRRNGP
jgi:hypothetical protein